MQAVDKFVDLNVQRWTFLLYLVTDGVQLRGYRGGQLTSKGFVNIQAQQGLETEREDLELMYLFICLIILMFSHCILCSMSHGWLLRKALISHQGYLDSIPGQGHVSWVVRWFSAVPQGFSRLSGFSPSEKSNTFDLGCTPWS